jgi:hypothetical protein
VAIFTGIKKFDGERMSDQQGVVSGAERYESEDYLKKKQA